MPRALLPHFNTQLPVGRASAAPRAGGPLAPGRRWLAGLAGLMLATLALLLALPSGARAAELTVLQLAPLTGFDGGTGWHMQVGAEVAIAQANAEQLLPGHKLKLVTQDERRGELPEQLRQAAAQLAPVAVLGLHGRQGLAELAASGGLMERLGLPVIGTHTGMVRGAGLDAPWLFLTRGSHADEVEAVFQHLATVASRRLILASTDDEEGREITALVQQAAGRSGVQLVLAPAHAAGSAQVGAAVQFCLERGPDAILLASNTSAVANFAKLYVRGGGKGQLIALASAEATQLGAIVGADAARGVLISQVVPNPRDPKLALMREFQAAFKRFGPEGRAPSLVMTESYLAARVLIEALRRSPRPDGPALLRTLANLPSPLLVGDVPVVINRKGQPLRRLSLIGRDGALLY